MPRIELPFDIWHGPSFPLRQRPQSLLPLLLKTRFPKQICQRITIFFYAARIQSLPATGPLGYFLAARCDQGAACNITSLVCSLQASSIYIKREMRVKLAKVFRGRVGGPPGVLAKQRFTSPLAAPAFAGAGVVLVEDTALKPDERKIVTCGRRTPTATFECELRNPFPDGEIRMRTPQKVS